MIINLGHNKETQEVKDFLIYHSDIFHAAHLHIKQAQYIQHH